MKQWPNSSKRWALIIGVDNYIDRQIGSLHGAANDARLLVDALVQRAGFPSDQVVLLATDQPAERQPTRVNILRRLSNLAAVVPTDGLLLFAFAGHGMERTGQAFLLPSDAQISNDVDFLGETSLSVTRIRDRVRATGVQQVIFFLDACRNDPTGRADAPNNLTEAYTRGFSFDVRNKEVTAFATLYATQVGERAYEYSEKRQGYFSWAIVEGLKGGAANEKGEITLAGLLKYIQDAVPKRIGIDLGAGKNQRPFAIIEGYKADELVIAVAGPISHAAEPGATAQPSVDPAAIELSYWNSIKDSQNPEDFRSYLRRYPTGKFAELASLRARAAKTETQPTGLPPVTTEALHWHGNKAAAWICSGSLIVDSAGFRYEGSKHRFSASLADIAAEVDKHGFLKLHFQKESGGGGGTVGAIVGGVTGGDKPKENEKFARTSSSPDFKVFYDALVQFQTRNAATK